MIMETRHRAVGKVNSASKHRLQDPFSERRDHPLSEVLLSLVIWEEAIRLI